MFKRPKFQCNISPTYYNDYVITTLKKRFLVFYPSDVQINIFRFINHISVCYFLFCQIHTASRLINCDVLWPLVR